MATKKFDPIEKYMSAEDFVDYCETNKVWASLDILGKYEEAGLLHPIYRLIYPEDYIKANLQNRFPNQQVEVPPPEWAKELNRRIDIFKMPMEKECYVMAINDGYPLDWLAARGTPDLLRPSKNNFIPWDNYKVNFEINGNNISETRARYFYAPWQIFALDELNRNNSFSINLAISRQINQRLLKREIQNSKVLDYLDIFQSLAEYIMIDRVLYNYYSQKGVSQIPEEKSIKEKEVYRIYKKHTREEWLNLVREMMALYSKYTKLEKKKLSEELKIYLKNAVEFLLIINKAPSDNISEEYEKICEEVEGISHKSRGASMINGILIDTELEKILPNNEKELKQHIKLYFPIYMKELGLTDKDFTEEISNKIAEELLSGYSAMAFEIMNIQKLLYHGELFWEENILSRLRSSTLSIEGIGKEWFLVNGLLNDLFKKAFGKDSLEKYNYENLRSVVCNSCNVKDFNEYYEKLVKILAFNIKDNSYCGKHLLIVHLTRNYMGHYSKIDDLFFLNLREIYKAIVLTLISLYMVKPKDPLPSSSPK
ncbi:hypothetical protein COS16_02095 [Candidatus Desantisbacteria bacterium CG02_land_8_20_14_3_00_49_13]|nr:MAG: hypothetical protein COS16_02095 [Candidatus Desantisbacteria bacterium CG02_land_8_20_14_3_00_49_13]